MKQTEQKIKEPENKRNAQIKQNQDTTKIEKEGDFVQGNWTWRDARLCLIPF